MEEKSRNRQHYAWKIMIACIFIKLGTSGAVYAAMGNFVAPIVSELGCQVSELTVFTSVQAISMALLYTTASRKLTSQRPGIIMGIASLAEVVGLAMMASYHSVYMFYVSGLIIGIAQAFTGFVAIPIVISMWFQKRTGMVLGVIVAVGSAAAIGYGLLSAYLITNLGWRAAYLILALMGLVITVPFVFLFIKSPAQAGCQPYGAEHGNNSPAATKTAYDFFETGLTKRQAFRTPAVFVAWVACVFYSYGSGVAGYVTPFSTMELHQTINFGARAGVFMSIGGVLGSLVLGRINDKLGVRAGLVWGGITTTLGYAGMFLSFGNPAWVYPASLVVGLGNSMYTVQCPLLARSVVGSKHYSEIWSVMMMVNSLVGGGLYSSIGLFYDKFGSYSGAFTMGIALYIGAMILGFVAISLSKKHRPAGSV